MILAATAGAVSCCAFEGAAPGFGRLVRWAFGTILSATSASTEEAAGSPLLTDSRALALAGALRGLVADADLRPLGSDAPAAVPTPFEFIASALRVVAFFGAEAREVAGCSPLSAATPVPGSRWTGAGEALSALRSAFDGVPSEEAFAVRDDFAGAAATRELTALSLFAFSRFGPIALDLVDGLLVAALELAAVGG